MSAVELRPMTAVEYDGWLPTSIEDYAAEHARAGSRPADKSLEMAHEEFQRLLPDGLATPEHHLLVGLTDGGERVGFLWLRIPPAGSGEADAFVYNVEVDADKRGNGHGRGLMRAAESYARDQGSTALRLHVFGHNTVARSLYERLGYETTNVTMVKPLYPTA